MTVLVTGGCGYIGAHVVHALHQAGEQVVVVDDLSYGKPTRIEGSRLYGMDIAAPGAGERLAEIMKAEGVDSVIHFAARKQVGESVEKPLWYYQQNINGMLNVLIGMRDSGAKKLVFSSSAATYGVPPVDVVPEDVVPMLPINPYGQTKLFGEWMARACEEPYGIRFCGLRYFNVFGRRQDPNGAYAAVIPLFVKKFLNHEAPNINGDGEYSRDFTYVDNVIQMNIRAMETTNPEAVNQIYNTAYGDRTTLNQLVGYLKEFLSEYDSAIAQLEPTHGPNRAGDIPHSLASIDKARKLLGYDPQYSLRDGLKEAVKWYRENL